MSVVETLSPPPPVAAAGLPPVPEYLLPLVRFLKAENPPADPKVLRDLLQQHGFSVI